MTRITVALLSIGLFLAVACGGGDKEGGLLGGGGSSSSSGGGDPKEPVAFAERSLLTMFNMFGGSVDPQRYLDLYLPECRTGVKASDVTQVLTMIKAFFPDINKLKVEDIDLGNPKVEKNGSDVKITITDSSKIRVKVNGKFVPAQEFFKSIGFDDPNDSPLEVTDEPLLLKEQDGKLYIANCDDLADIANQSSSRSATPTPQRASASPTPQRTATVQATAVIGRTSVTQTAGPTATPQRSNTAGITGAVVKTTPTAGQRYPANIETNFMNACTRGGTSTATCRCMLDILEARLNVDAFAELERAVSRGERTSELTAVVNACI